MTFLFLRPLNFILGKTLAVWVFKGLVPLNYESHLQHSTPNRLKSFHDPYRYEFAHCTWRHSQYTICTWGKKLFLESFSGMEVKEREGDLQCNLHFMNFYRISRFISLRQDSVTRPKLCCVGPWLSTSSSIWRLVMQLPKTLRVVIV